MVVVPAAVVLTYVTATSAETVGVVVLVSVAPGIAVETAVLTVEVKLEDATAVWTDVATSVALPSPEIVNGTVQAVASVWRRPEPVPCTGVWIATCDAATVVLVLDAAAAMEVASELDCAVVRTSVVPSGAPRTRLEETGRSLTTTCALLRAAAGRLSFTLAAKFCGWKATGLTPVTRALVEMRTVEGGGAGEAAREASAQVPLALKAPIGAPSGVVWVATVVVAGHIGGGAEAKRWRPAEGGVPQSGEGAENKSEGEQGRHGGGSAGPCAAFQSQTSHPRQDSEGPDRNHAHLQGSSLTTQARHTTGPRSTCRSWRVWSCSTSTTGSRGTHRPWRFRQAGRPAAGRRGADHRPVGPRPESSRSAGFLRVAGSLLRVEAKMVTSYAAPDAMNLLTGHGNRSIRSFAAGTMSLTRAVE